MLYTKKVDSFFKGALTFMLISVCGFPCYLYAANLTDLINSVSANENSFCTETDCFFPEKEDPADNDIYIEGKINWSKDKNLVLYTKKSIVFKKGGEIINEGNGSIILKSGMMPRWGNVYDSTVKFEGGIDQIKVLGKGKVKIYYNPTKGKEKHKYHNPTIYNDYFSQLEPETYRLVNDVYDLQGIVGCLYGAYALSQDIDASVTGSWNNGKGFTPIKNIKNGAPFSGIFDGNHHIVKNLYINRPEEDMVGLFGDVTGVNEYRSLLRDFTVDNAYIRGRSCVGVIIGQATGVEIYNVNVSGSRIYSSTDDFSKIGGCILVNKHKLVSANDTILYKNGVKQEDNNKLFGSCVHCEGSDADKKETENKDKKERQ